MLKQDEKEKIERYLNGLSDNDEQSFIESLFSKGKNNDYLKHYLEADWNRMVEDQPILGVDLSHLLDRVHHIIRKNEIGKRQKPSQRILRLYMKVAAILLLPLLITGSLVYYFEGNRNKSANGEQVNSTIYAPLGARISFNLPDGTTGKLNSGSHLTYSIPFNNNRSVILDGEAWFEVKHDENHPFRISAGNSTIKVLGTSFNLSAYPVENYIEVVLQQGKVEFHDNNSNMNITMLPSERLVFQDGKISKTVTDAAKYNSWTSGQLVFRGDLMAEVARRIERWYNVKIVLADKELEKYSFRATFEDDKIEEVLHLLSMTSPIRYEIEPRKMIADGTYEKEKVTIYLKK